MKKIELKKLWLLNFKGARSLEVNFNHLTNISGDNGLFKTTIQDSFIWLLFGKDSTDRKDFQVKTLDANNKEIHRLEHSVTGHFIIDDSPMTIKRVLKEKWVKKKGAEEEVFSGNETEFFVDDVPLKSGEFKAKVDAIVDETVFKLVTSPTYFNSLHWEKRRDILLTVCPPVNDDEIAKPDYKALIDRLTGKCIDDYAKEIKAKKANLKKAMAEINPKIEEKNRDLIGEPDYAIITKELEATTKELQKVESQITDRTKISDEVYQSIEDWKSKRDGLETRKQELESKIGNEFRQSLNSRNSDKSTLEQQKNNLEYQIVQAKNNIAEHENSIKLKNERRAVLREEWNKINSEEYTPGENGEFNCPACNRPLDADDIEKKKLMLAESFNKKKLNSLSQIENEGESLKTQVESLQKYIKEYADKKKHYEEELKEVTDKINQDSKPLPTQDELLAKNEEYQKILTDIANLPPKPEITPVDISDLETEKNRLNGLIYGFNAELSKKDAFDKSRARIKELETELSTYSQQLANLEKDEFIIENFNFDKMNEVEKRVNGMFSMVKFKMFNTLINGGIEPTCETLVNGVPYSDVNSAGKTNAGLDIINTLCKFHEVQAPVWVDNAEGANELIPIESQMIRLVVTKDKSLIIN